MPQLAPRTPSYRLHKPTGLAVVTLDGRDFYLGGHGSPESRAEYDRMVAQWLTNGRRLAAPSTGKAAGTDITVNEMVLAYLDHADGYYVKRGKPTVEPGNIRLAIRPLRQLYGHSPAREFGPLALKAVRRAMVDSGLCRLEINRRVGRVVRAFKWGVSEEMIPPSVHQALQTVPGLRHGRSEVRESEPVRPAPEVSVDAIAPHVCGQVWAMVQLQRLTGMRPGEVTIMRTRDLDMSGPVWIYVPETHKTEHRGRERRVFLGPQVQAILRPWLRPDLNVYLFSPAEATAARMSKLREGRKTPVQPSQKNRAKSRPSKSPGRLYSVESYRRAVSVGCDKAGVPRWHPHQLRHNAATRLRREFGLDTARAVLGHSSTAVTEIYAELDLAKAAEAMGRVG